MPVDLFAASLRIGQLARREPTASTLSSGIVDHRKYDSVKRVRAG